MLTIGETDHQILGVTLVEYQANYYSDLIKSVTTPQTMSTQCLSINCFQIERSIWDPQVRAITVIQER